MYVNHEVILSFSKFFFSEFGHYFFFVYLCFEYLNFLFEGFFSHGSFVKMFPDLLRYFEITVFSCPSSSGESVWTGMGGLGVLLGFFSQDESTLCPRYRDMQFPY